MTVQPKDVLVLGAGPAGISAAHRLVKAGHRVTVVERRDTVGGLGGTFKWHDFHLDYGPHAFHPHPSVVMENVSALFEGEDTLIHQNRNERLLLHNRLFNYPIQMWELLFRMNPFRTLHMGFAFVMASIIYRYIAVPDDTFESWCIKRFGKPLYRLIFGNYTSKVWGIPPRKISAKFAKQKIKELNLRDLIKKLLGSKGEETIDYWDDLFYPKLGSGQLYDRYKTFLEELGVAFRLNTEPVGFDIQDDRITAVHLRSEGQEEQVSADLVVSTIPVTKLVELLGRQISPYVAYTAGRLRFRSLALLFIELAVPYATQRHWIYLLDARYKSNRFTEQKNMSPDTCPKDRTVICFERSCDYKDSQWNTSDEDFFKQVMEEDVRPNPLLDESLARRHHVVRIRHAYPVYDLEFDHNLRVVLDGLAGIENLYSTGRQGLFLQNGMHQSMVMGWEAAEVATAGATPWNWYQTILRKWDMD